MLTNPNTLGLFDENIAEIAAIVHEAGGTLYYDGANLNAIMGHCRPGDMGFDIVHVNLHKSFSPAARRRRTRGRADRRFRSDRALPAAAAGDPPGGAERRPSPPTSSTYERPKSIGRLRGFQGNFGVFVRSYAYMLSLGGDGLTEASETAVLNANYLLARLGEGAAGEHVPVAFDRRCMHEFVLSGGPAAKELGVKTLDIAKRLLDHGMHPPTVYFPLLVDEALMVEPTETETRETLDAFAEAIESILAEAADDPEIARNAPYTTPVRRLDEAAAARKPVDPPALIDRVVLAPPSDQSRSCSSIAAVSWGSSGSTETSKCFTGRPWRSSRYLLKFQVGAPSEALSFSKTGLSGSSLTFDFSNIGKLTP